MNNRLPCRKRNCPILGLVICVVHEMKKKRVNRRHQIARALSFFFSPAVLIYVLLPPLRPNGDGVAVAPRQRGSIAGPARLVRWASRVSSPPSIIPSVATSSTHSRFQTSPFDLLSTPDAIVETVGSVSFTSDPQVAEQTNTSQNFLTMSPYAHVILAIQTLVM